MSITLSATSVFDGICLPRYTAPYAPRPISSRRWNCASTGCERSSGLDVVRVMVRGGGGASRSASDPPLLAWERPLAPRVCREREAASLGVSGLGASRLEPDGFSERGAMGTGVGCSWRI